MKNTNTTNNQVANDNFTMPSTPTIIKDVDYFISKKGTTILKVTLEDGSEKLVTNKYDICNILKNVLANCTLEPIVAVEDKPVASKDGKTTFHNVNVLVMNGGAN